MSSVKFLILRFSSIGDIVLTTPVIRGIKKQVNRAEVHFLTKPAFAHLVENNPFVDKVHVLKDDLKDTIDDLKSENYNYVIDLHNNLRTARIKAKLPVLNFTFSKLNIEKWLLVNLKINRLPDIHIVDRYLQSVEVFGVKNDGEGLDYFIPEQDEVNPEDLHAAFSGRYLVLVLGANHGTKQIPIEHLAYIANRSGVPVALVGGSDVDKAAKELELLLKVPFLNTVGKFNLNQSASLIEQSFGIITADTGMMHIAAALNVPIISMWGNTVPEFGMTPYNPNPKSSIFEVDGLRCRPCSKIGFNKCPKGHFYCMKKQNVSGIVEKIGDWLN